MAKKRTVSIKEPIAVVLGDPAWAYNDRLEDDRMRGGASQKYELMNQEEICALPVKKLVADDAVCFLWATYPFLREGIEVLEEWGFSYVNAGFTWTKYTAPKKFLDSYTAMEKIIRGTYEPSLPGWQTCLQSEFPKGDFKPKFGNGHYTKHNEEICLFGRRGKFLKPATDKVSELIIAPLRDHSRKPWEARWRIECMYPGLPKLELYAREQYPDWIALGYDIDGEDLRNSVPKLVRKLKHGQKS
jgi:N6-adenosine-specific RNA methylase IME4